jgi:hypothetical protein
MRKPKLHNQGPAKAVVWLLIEIIIYTAFVTVYYFSVLLLLRGWLKHMFDAHKIIYAIAGLLLIIVQAVLLDFVAIGLRKWGGGKSK